MKKCASMALRVFQLLLAVLPTAAAAVTVEGVGPRPQAVLDQAGLLDAQAEAEIEAIAAGIRARQGADLVVVTLPSADGLEPHAFATRLINRWELGDRTRDDGVLLLVAVEQRAVELVLGDGIDDDAQAATAQRIVDERMLPSLRAGDPQAALLGGSRAIAADLFGLIALDADAQPVERAAPAAAPAAVAPAAAAPTQDVEVTWGVWAVLAAMLAGFVGVLALIWNLLRRVYGWLRTPSCPQCKVPMFKLDETADDAHLAAGELAEERLRSVDYAIWTCASCKHMQKRRHGRWFTPYSRCPQCHVVASKDTTRTLTSATTYSTGLEEVTTECAYCKRRAVDTRTTPMISRSSSSSSSRSSWGGGGGSSSGRGGSGRW